MNTRTPFQQLIDNHEWQQALAYINTPENNQSLTDKEFNSINMLLTQKIGMDYTENKEYVLAEKFFLLMQKFDESQAQSFIELSHLYKLQGKFEQAKNILLDALKHQSNHPDLLNDLGIIHHAMGEHEQGITLYQKALAASENHPLASYNLGIAQLLKGNYEDGFKLCESRFKTAKFALEDEHFIKKYWHGEPLENKKIFIVAEQGFGDAILFFRLIPQLKKNGTHITLCCREPLHRLFSKYDFIDAIQTVEEKFPEYDYHMPQMSLGSMLHLDKKDISGAAYLKANKQSIQEWSNKISSSDFKIGLVWQGNPEFTFSCRKDCPPELLEPLFNLENVQIYNLQMGINESPYFSKFPNFIDLTKEIKDFEDTAAIIENLDLVITVDTAVAHLAGALGKAVFILAYSPPAWQWGLSGEKVAWYESATLFRQPKDGDWSQIIPKAIASVQKLASR